MPCRKWDFKKMGRAGRPGFSGVARRAIACGLAFSLAVLPLSACSGSNADTGTSSAAAATSVVQGENVDLIDTGDVFSDRDLSADYDDEVTNVTLSDEGSSADGQGVAVDGSTITISAAGTYVLSGTLTDGQVVVDAGDDDKVQLVLSGASVTCSSGAAILVENADKCFVTLDEGTDNTVASTGGLDSEESNVDGAIFSRDDLTINGTGTLVVESSGHGIVCKDDLVLAGATATITAAGSAIQAKDSVAVASGTWTLDAQNDGIHAENDEDDSQGWVYVQDGTLSITAADDGIWAGNVVQVDGGSLSLDVADDAVHAEWELAANDGNVDIAACYEGLEGSKVYVTGGTISIVSSDDALNATGDPDDEAADDGDDIETRQMPGFEDMGDMMGDDSAYLLISGGVTTIQAGGDGLDSNGDFDMTGGEVYVSGPTSGADGSIDYGEGCEASITGGTIICAGSSGMAETFGETSSQCSALVSLSGQAGDTIEVCDEQGNVLASMVASTSYDCVVASVDGMEVGETYEIGNGTDSVTVEFDSVVYSEMGGAMGFGGGFGQMDSPDGDMGGSSDGTDGGFGGSGGSGQAPSGGMGDGQGFGQAPGDTQGQGMGASGSA